MRYRLSSVIPMRFRSTYGVERVGAMQRVTSTWVQWPWVQWRGRIFRHRLVVA